MNDNPLPTSFPGLLAGHLAKLNHQLRHLLADGLDPAPGKDAGQAHAVICRLRVAAALLSAPDEGQGAEQAPLQRLGLVLSELVAGIGDKSNCLPAYLLSPLGQLAEFLDQVFERLDAGEEPCDVCDDIRWEALLAAFINAGTVLQALDEVEEKMQAWSRRYAESDLSVSQEEALQCRWALLRDFGDTLFGTADHAAGDGPAARGGRELVGRRVLMLLDSPFRQSQLCERLRAAGCAVETAGDPGGLMARVGDPLPPEILLCDNLEPSLHLTAVREKMKALAQSEWPPLILVATAGGSPANLRDRAKHLGAQGTWADPFRPEDLAAALG